MLTNLKKQNSKFLVKAFIAVTKKQNSILPVNQAIRLGNIKTALKNELIKRGIEPKDLA